MEIMPSANIISKLLEQTMGQLEWEGGKWMEKSGGFWENSAENASFISFVTCWILIFSSFLLHLSSGCVKNHDLAIMRQMCALGMPTTLANKRAVRYRLTGTHGG